MTSRARHTFEVKFHFDKDDRPRAWIVLTLVRAPDLPILQGGILGLDLHPETSIDEAERLADMLNDMVASTTYTHPSSEAERMREEHEELAARKRNDKLM